MMARMAVRRFAGERDEGLAEAMSSHGLDEEGCLAAMANLAERVPHAMERVFEEDAGIPGIDELREHLLAPVGQNCARTLALL